MTQIKTK